MRRITEQELIHERLGPKFEQALSRYDTTRRVEVLIADFLDSDLRGLSALDVGCGLGFFSQALKARGADVVACDISEKLLDRVRAEVRCKSVCADALALVEHFGENRFDIVVSSECIEHTPSPENALQQMARVLKPNGRLAVSTPNLVWYPIVKFATVAKLRPFDGLENFSTFRSIRAVLRREGLLIRQERGLHLFPFQLRCFGVSRWFDEHVQFLRSIMINLCVLAEKTSL